MVSQQEQLSADKKSGLGLSFITRAWNALRNEANAAIEYGTVIATTSAAIALAGLYYWCPRCGQWMGESPPPEAGISPKAPPVPRRLIKALSSPVQGEPGPLHGVPPEQEYTLGRHKGNVYYSLNALDSEVKTIYNPPSQTDHARTIDSYWGGANKPDDPADHAHQKNYIAPDGTDTLIYVRPPGPKATTPPDYDSGISVSRMPDGTYKLK